MCSYSIAAENEMEFLTLKDLHSENEKVQPLLT